MKTAPRIGVIIAGILIAVFIGVTDYLSGYELSFSIFYMIPVIAVTWFAGSLPGIVASVVSALIWFVSDLYSGHPYSQFLIPYWNAFVRLCFFLIATFSVSAHSKFVKMEKDLARTDELTGLENVRSFFELANLEIERARRHKRPFSVAYIDADNFKTVNDTHGHATGDELLKIASGVLLDNVREIDIVARLGGDEFLILMPETDRKQVSVVVERIKEKLQSSMEWNNWPVTFSMGVVTFDSPPSSARDIISKADKLMYKAKNTGKNKIEHSTFNYKAMPHSYTDVPKNDD